jgi:hypothetical protein
VEQPIRFPAPPRSTTTTDAGRSGLFEDHLSRQRRQGPKPGRSDSRRRRSPASEKPFNAPIPLNEDGAPAATLDGPRPSPVVFVTAESLARYPWLPPRVIAGSIWSGPAQVRVRVDETGAAVP